MKEQEFASDTKIDFRVTGYEKKLIKMRARNLRKSMSRYIKDLIKVDLTSKEDEKDFID